MDFAFDFAVVGQTSARQKLMTCRFIRESQDRVIAMDSFNAQQKKLEERAEKLVIFKPSLTGDGGLEGMPVEWPVGRVLLEGNDFRVGTFPVRKTNA